MMLDQSVIILLEITKTCKVSKCTALVQLPSTFLVPRHTLQRPLIHSFRHRSTVAHRNQANKLVRNKCKSYWRKIWLSKVMEINVIFGISSISSTSVWTSMLCILRGTGKLHVCGKVSTLNCNLLNTQAHQFSSTLLHGHKNITQLDS